MSKIGSYTVEEIVAFSNTIPDMHVHYDGNAHILEYQGTGKMEHPTFRLTRGTDLDHYVGWLKYVHMALKHAHSLPSRKTIEQMLRDRSWN